MLLTPEQLDEFKAEGALAIPGLVPPDVIDGWQAQLGLACSDGVDLAEPDTWPPVGMRPRVVGPNSTPTCTTYRICSLS